MSLSHCYFICLVWFRVSAHSVTLFLLGNVTMLTDSSCINLMFTECLCCLGFSGCWGPGATLFCDARAVQRGPSRGAFPICSLLAPGSGGGRRLPSHLRSSLGPRDQGGCRQRVSEGHPLEDWPILFLALGALQLFFRCHPCAAWP